MAEKKHGRVTIVDVANMAGVSKSLASRALRGESGVSPENRERVLAVAAELNYHPSFAARALRADTRVLGVVLNDIGNPHNTAIVAGIEAEALAARHGVVLGNGAENPDKLGRVLNEMIELGVNGIIIVSSWVRKHDLERVGATVPTCVVARYDSLPDTIDSVTLDDVEGGRRACEHLLSVGARKIAYVTRSASATSRARERGVREVTMAAGIELATHHLALWDSGQIREIIRSGGYDGIVANNDMAAAEVLRAAADERIRVPADLAVIGYDDTTMARVLSPTLSSIAQPQERMGRRAVELVMSRIDGRSEPIRAMFEPELVVRRSTMEPRT
ncbi:LacI family DNA-binding transcriptional regulator [Trueperella bialowiezensis]|uniref:Degradation activator n=1 Tax=Trueperella bialowiezensis TaxID=312285 RepID=A0A448PEZ0_9ACTO|nr:LacI family DNA-binding transcriptional regulator [Trueperella bialowiezensis]VEI13503.1 Degradation activator [Trueperella bialowiezensis]